MARYRLRYLGDEIPLKRGAFAIGRSSSCDLCLDDERVSRRHVVLHVKSDSLVLEDLGSRNGVLLNDERITGSRPLRHGDRIAVGSQHLLVVDEQDRERRAHKSTVSEESSPPAVAPARGADPDQATLGPEQPSAAEARISAAKLSPREREVLRLLARGHTHKEIATRLGLSAKTVETYRERLGEKLGLRGRADIIQYALRAGLATE